MAEVTRVPLQPIAKGSLAKLWLGVAAAVLLAAGIAWAAVPQGVDVEEVRAGTGPTAQVGDVVFVKYTGKLADGTVFDQSQSLPLPPGLLPDGNPFPIEEGATIPGFEQGLQQMQKDGKYVLEIPSELAYGDEPPPGSGIPAGADLVFDMEVTEIMSREDFQRRVAMVQQMMQQQQQQQMQEGAPQPGQ